MEEDRIWHDWDPFRQVLKVAFVRKDGVGVFIYRLCPEYGVSMERDELADVILWTCTVRVSEI